jgi:REP-associated tyrosine transposase
MIPVGPTGLPCRLGYKGGVVVAKSKNVLEFKEFYRRYLPHWQPAGAMIFITYRLVDSLPKHVLQKIENEHQQNRRDVQAAGKLNSEMRWFLNKKRSIAIDEALDSEKSGPHWLSDSRVAELIVGNLHHHAGQLYHLWAYVLMSNHVHALLQPLAIVTQTAGLGSQQNTKAQSGRLGYAPTDYEQGIDLNCVSLARIYHSLKSYTSKKANAILERQGKFWQIESYDHWIRDEQEFWRVIEYIENNPVKVGLCQKPEDWEWSSAYKRKELGLDYQAPLPKM